MTMSITPAEDHACRRAAQLLDEADGLVIAAGAGFGVEAGLPDFRGPQGSWRAYPALDREGLSFTDIANPQAFQMLRFAWGFYGHRLALYRRTEPHIGYHILRALAERAQNGAFVFTSNVDGRFQRAGFCEEQVVEVQGSIHRLQCVTPCTATLRPADELVPHVDDARREWQGPLPTCLRCGELARPNILRFGDAKHVAVEIRLGALASMRTIANNLATPLAGLNRLSVADRS